MKAEVKKIIDDIVICFNAEHERIVEFASAPDYCEDCKWNDVCNIAAIDCEESCALFWSLNRVLEGLLKEKGI